jgi:hypothetical protein
MLRCSRASERKKGRFCLDRQPLGQLRPRRTGRAAGVRRKVKTWADTSTLASFENSSEMLQLRATEAGLNNFRGKPSVSIMFMPGTPYKKPCIRGLALTALSNFLRSKDNEWSSCRGARRAWRH